MPLTLMESEFFDKVMAVNRKADDGYHIKDPPKEEGIGFLEFARILIKAVAVAYMIFYFLRVVS